RARRHGHRRRVLEADAEFGLAGIDKHFGVAVVKRQDFHVDAGFFEVALIQCHVEPRVVGIRCPVQREADGGFRIACRCPLRLITSRTASQQGCESKDASCGDGAQTNRCSCHGFGYSFQDSAMLRAISLGLLAAHSAETKQTPAAPADRRSAMSSWRTPPMATVGTDDNAVRCAKPAMPSAGG